MGCSDFQTPNLDRMADEGARFTFGIQQSCLQPIPSRITNGRYPGNAGVRQILAGHRTASGLPMEYPR